jgi:ABC-type glycerol-3-phosphate transport system substrate-binding protein
MRKVTFVVSILVVAALLATPTAAANQLARTLEAWTLEFPPLQDAMTKKRIPQFEARIPMST